MFLEESALDQALAAVTDEDILVKQLVTALRKGHTALVYEGPAVTSPFLHYEKGHLFLKSIFALQQKLKELTPTYASVTTDLPETLLPEQKAAVLFALSSSLTLLTGGPGTGKSFTIASFIRSYFTLNGLHKKVALAAPTGKATQHLKPLLGDLPVTLATLHRLLEVYKQPLIGHEEKRPLVYDLIIVDEASMIDLPLMARLFDLMKQGSKLLLVGDPSQLPPVGFGQPFIDLLTLYPEQVVSLTHCMRSDRQEILALASAIRNSEALPPLTLSWPPTFSSYDYGSSAEEALSNQNRYRILSPLALGPFGAKAISDTLFRRQRGSFFAPIIITENAFKQGLYNGLLGVLEVANGLYKRAYFMSESGLQSYAAADLPAFDLAYCISVHKAQGSEFDTVFFVIPPTSENFGRSLLYTGVTRAKKELQIAAPEGQIDLCLKTARRRITGN
jgi:exodeoxyribonuclease V alpha subunit